MPFLPLCLVQEALEACQTRISKMELQQQQQQVVQLEGLENATARTLLGKLINVLLALMAVLLVFVSTVANCVVPLMKTRSRSLSTLLLILLLAFLWRNWDALSGYTHRALQPPGWPGWNPHGCVVDAGQCNCSCIQGVNWKNETAGVWPCAKNSAGNIGQTLKSRKRERKQS